MPGYDLLVIFCLGCRLLLLMLLVGTLAICRSIGICFAGAKASRAQAAAQCAHKSHHGENSWHHWYAPTPTTPTTTTTRSTTRTTTRTTTWTTTRARRETSINRAALTSLDNWQWIRLGCPKLCYVVAYYDALAYTHTFTPIHTDTHSLCIFM